MASDERNFLQSSRREKIVEHIFVGELLRYLWATKMDSVEILKPEVDNAGYDIVVTNGRVVRHVQLKASVVGGSARNQKVNASLASHPCGCVVWILIDDKLNFQSFLWFGGSVGERLPDISTRKQAKSPRGNALGVKPLRKNTKVIPKSAFEKVQSIGDLATKLFGAVDR
jgi:hypothetical protein